MKGATLIDGKEYYFDDKTGAQVKGVFGSNGKYYDTSTGALVTNRYVNVDKYWYYVDAEGKPLKGSQTINNVPVYFDSYYGRQVKGDFGDDGYYYDKDSGTRITLEKIVTIILITIGIMSVQMAKSLKATTSSMVFRYILIGSLEHKLKMAL